MGITPSKNDVDNEKVEDRSIDTDEDVDVSESTQSALIEYSEETSEIVEGAKAEQVRREGIEEGTDGEGGAAYNGGWDGNELMADGGEEIDTEEAQIADQTEAAGEPTPLGEYSAGETDSAIEEAQSIYEDSNEVIWEQGPQPDSASGGVPDGQGAADESDWAPQPGESSLKQEEIQRRREEQSQEAAESGSQMLGNHPNVDADDLLDDTGDHVAGLDDPDQSHGVTDNGEELVPSRGSANPDQSYQSGTAPGQGEFQDTITQQDEVLDAQAAADFYQTASQETVQSEDVAAQDDWDDTTNAHEVNDESHITEDEAGVPSGETIVVDRGATTDVIGNTEGMSLAAQEVIEGKAEEARNLRAARLDRELGRGEPEANHLNGEVEQQSDFEEQSREEFMNRLERQQTHLQNISDKDNAQAPELMELWNRVGYDSVAERNFHRSTAEMGSFGARPGHNPNEIDGVGRPTISKLRREVNSNVESSDELTKLESVYDLRNLKDYDFTQVNGVGEQTAEQLSQTATEMAELENEIQSQANKLALEFTNDEQFQDEMDRLDYIRNANDDIDTSVITGRQDIERILRQNALQGRSPDAVSEVIRDREARRKLLTSKNEYNYPREVAPLETSLMVDSVGRDYPEYESVDELTPFAEEVQVYEQNLDATNVQAGESPSPTGETMRKAVPHGNTSVKARVIGTRSQDFLENTIGRDDIFQQVKVKDPQGSETWVTVWDDSVQFPDAETEATADEVSTTQEGIHTDLSRQKGVDPDQDTLKVGDKVRMKNLQVNTDETTVRDPETGETKVVERDILNQTDGHTLSTVPETEFEFIEKGPDITEPVTTDPPSPPTAREYKGEGNNQTRQHQSFEDKTVSEDEEQFMDGDTSSDDAADDAIDDVS